MTKVIDNPGLLAMQAETRKSIDASIKKIEEGRKARLADTVNTADGDAMTVDEALAALDEGE